MEDMRFVSIPIKRRTIRVGDLLTLAEALDGDAKEDDVLEVLDDELRWER